MTSLRAELVRRGFAAAIGVQRAIGQRGITAEATAAQVAEMAVSLREQAEAFASRSRIPSGIDVEEATGPPVPATWVRAGSAEDEPVIMHLHGGAYFMCSPSTHRGLAIALSRAAHAPVLLPAYRLAPEHPFPAALDDAEAAYRWLLDECGVPAGRIAVTGDSAGGGLALALLVRLRDAGVPLPACYVGMSPWTDLAGTGETMASHAERDPWLRAEMSPLAARAYAGDTPLDHPGVSPLYADLSGLPPMLVHVGSEEILLDDARRVVERVRERGGVADLAVFEGLWHVFQAFTGLPESRFAVREIAAFVRRHTGTAPGPMG